MANIGRVVRNQRFLILPSVRVRGLPSQALRRATERIAGDWEAKYGVRPVLAYSFTGGRHAGGSYRAARWRCCPEKSSGRRPGERCAVWVKPLEKGWQFKIIRQQMLRTLRTMNWNSKYWDIVDDFYWAPNYLGLKSIGRKKWTERDGLICIPSEQVNRTGPIYTRVRKADENFGDLRREEQILNHMFDLTFAIAGNSVVWELLVEPLGFEDRGPFESLGKEVSDR